MADYNERLFSGGFRGWLHSGRFQWLRNATREIDVSSVFELGCFDGKSISYLPREPDRYLGVAGCCSIEFGWLLPNRLGRLLQKRLPGVTKAEKAFCRLTVAATTPDHPAKRSRACWTRIATGDL